MLKSLTLSTLLATVTLANAQSPASQPPTPPDPAAPIIRSYPAPPRPIRQRSQVVDAQPISGVWLRSDAGSALETITATPQHAEIRLNHGRLNVTVHQPAQHAEILISLPGGQISLLKDGLYTFNADTNTVRVLRGEAAALPGPNAPKDQLKPIKIKEDHQLSLVSAPNATRFELRSVECYPYELAADLLPPANSGDYASAENGYANGYPGDYPRYEYPYYAGSWGYPAYYGYGYPFTYGIGFGYYGGYRGGFRR